MLLHHHAILLIIPCVRFNIFSVYNITNITLQLSRFDVWLENIKAN